MSYIAIYTEDWERHEDRFETLAELQTWLNSGITRQELTCAKILPVIVKPQYVLEEE